MKIIETGFQWAYALTPRAVTTHLILHHAAAEEATAEGIHSYHCSRGWAGIAYHYFVRKDGSIYRGRPENMKGGHTSNWNWCSIGICFEGNFDEETMSPRQQRAGRELIADIMSRYPSIEVGKHSEYGQTACPGKNFPFGSLLEAEAAEPAGENAEGDELPDEWASSACMWAVGKGIFKGDENADYRWHSALTRQELAVLLLRYDQMKSKQ